jgi:hypothetical protein
MKVVPNFKPNNILCFRPTCFNVLTYCTSDVSSALSTIQPIYSLDLLCVLLTQSFQFGVLFKFCRLDPFTNFVHYFIIYFMFQLTLYF